MMLRKQSAMKQPWFRLGTMMETIGASERSAAARAEAAAGIEEFSGSSIIPFQDMPLLSAFIQSSSIAILGKVDETQPTG